MDLVAVRHPEIPEAGRGRMAEHGSFECEHRHPQPGARRQLESTGDVHRVRRNRAVEPLAFQIAQKVRWSAVLSRLGNREDAVLPLQQLLPGLRHRGMLAPGGCSSRRETESVDQPVEVVPIHTHEFGGRFDNLIILGLNGWGAAGR